MDYFAVAALNYENTLILMNPARHVSAIQNDQNARSSSCYSALPQQKPPLVVNALNPNRLIPLFALVRHTQARQEVMEEQLIIKPCSRY